jgi:UDP-N-acetylglucosamine 2-epimerase (non-hydrolysing)
MKVCIVAGARPNFMKIAPIIEAINNYNRTVDKEIDYYLVHTGQHYDQNMSKLFFDNLGIPSPDIDLEVGSCSHALQTAKIMKRFEKVCLDETPTHVLVVGDVNSTIACALVGSKLGIKIIHVEAGLRSFDRNMPEEINRVLTDAISDYLFTTENGAQENLRREGIPEEKIHFVGNVMIDTLFKHKRKAEKSDILFRIGIAMHQSDNLKNPNKYHLARPVGSEDRTGVKSECHLSGAGNSISSKNQIIPYAVLTLHRPSNVDDKETFQGILEALLVIGKNLPIIFPLHPRTDSRIKEFNFEKFFNWNLCNSRPTNPSNSINPIPPLGYIDFLNLMSNSELVLTDSGGIQEETTILGIPCVTIRDNTERPITVTHGTNVLSGTKKEDIVKSACSQLAISNKYRKSDKTNQPFKPNIPPLWDGNAAKRIVEVIVSESLKM